MGELLHKVPETNCGCFVFTSYYQIHLNNVTHKNLRKGWPSHEGMCPLAGRFTLSPHQFLLLPWLLFFLSTHPEKLLLKLNLFFLSVLFVRSKHSTFWFHAVIYRFGFTSLTCTHKMAEEKVLSPISEGSGLQLKTHGCIYPQEGQVHLTEPSPEHTVLLILYTSWENRGRKKRSWTVFCIICYQ